jgi:hypothetical protein
VGARVSGAIHLSWLHALRIDDPIQLAFRRVDDPARLLSFGIHGLDAIILAIMQRLASRQATVVQSAQSIPAVLARPHRSPVRQVQMENRG